MTPSMEKALATFFADPGSASETGKVGELVEEMNIIWAKLPKKTKHERVVANEIILRFANASSDLKRRF